jgi:hypothetical protein
LSFEANGLPRLPFRHRVSYLLVVPPRCQIGLRRDATQPDEPGNRGASGASLDGVVASPGVMTTSSGRWR